MWSLPRTIKFGLSVHLKTSMSNYYSVDFNGLLKSVANWWEGILNVNKTPKVLLYLLPTANPLSTALYTKHLNEFKLTGKGGV